jgi:hypothetical protein
MFVGVEYFQPLRSKGSIRSMRSRGWGFRKVGAAFICFLFLINYWLFKSSSTTVETVGYGKCCNV